METIKESYNWKVLISRTIIVIGLISGIITIYVFFFQDKKINLEFEVVSNTNVLDINANLSKLDVVYNGSSLKTSKQNLRIITIRIKNNGNESILKDYYDLNDPIGVSVTGSKIAEMPEVISTSNSYIKRNLRLKVDSSSVTFNDLILEPGESFVIKLLVLHQSNVIFKISSLGKIAGQSDIPIFTSIITKDKSLWSDAFATNTLIQIVRVIGYGLLFVGIVFLIGTVMFKTSDILEKRRKSRLIIKFKTKYGSQLNKMDEVIFNRFKQDGLNLLKQSLIFLRNEALIANAYNKHNDSKQIKQQVKTGKVFDIGESLKRPIAYGSHLLEKMISDGLIVEKDEQMIVNQLLKGTLILFVKFLKDENYSDESGVVIVDEPNAG